MSLSRIGEDGQWFDVTPGYVYIPVSQEGSDGFNVGIHQVDHFCELAMRALDQSGELNDETLEECEAALRSRFDFTLEEDDQQ